MESEGADLVPLLSDLSLDAMTFHWDIAYEPDVLKRALGIKMYFKVENPYEQRIQSFFMGEEKLDPVKVYKACCVTKKGVPEKYGRNHEKLPVKAIDALEHFLKEEIFNLYEADTYILI